MVETCEYCVGPEGDCFCKLGANGLVVPRWGEPFNAKDDAVEAVARAIVLANGGKWDKLTPGEVRHFMAVARAAIEAMRKAAPVDALIQSDTVGVLEEKSDGR